MFNLIWNFFKTAPDAPQMTDAAAIKKKFNAMRWRVFASITIGYAFYYIIRQSYSVIKKPLLASGIVTPTEIGIIGSIFFVTYGLGKFTNSFLADRMNNKRFFSFGLFISSLTMVGMGLSPWPSCGALMAGSSRMVPGRLSFPLTSGSAINNAGPYMASGSRATISALLSLTLPLLPSSPCITGLWDSFRPASFPWSVRSSSTLA